MRRKIIAFAVLTALFCAFALHAGAESVLNQLKEGVVTTADREPAAQTQQPFPAVASDSPDGEKHPSILWMLQLNAADPTEAAEEGASVLQALPPAAPDSMEAAAEEPILRMLPLVTEAPAETEETAFLPPEQPADIPVSAVLEELNAVPSEGLYSTASEAPDSSKGMWISGPEKMRAGTKKYYKAVFDEEKPKKYKVSWSLDCDPATARVYRNGQVWVRPKASAGTVLTLKCRVEGKDQEGQLWTAETTTEITVK